MNNDELETYRNNTSRMYKIATIAAFTLSILTIGAIVWSFK